MGDSNKPGTHLSKKEALMAISKFISLRSKEDETGIKEGSCIVDYLGRILSLGYRGLPANIESNMISFDIKYYIQNAISNAIALARRPLSNATLYTTKFPDEEACKAIIQSQIKNVFYADNEDEETTYIANKMLESAGIETHNLDKIEIIVPNDYDRSWDKTFAGLSNIIAMRSKDPNTQVGCCIADQSHRVISLGYNGMPFGCSDECFPWDRVGEKKDSKYVYVAHSELNAILSAQETSPLSLEGSSIYVNLFPCPDCAKMIIQKRIAEVFYILDKYHNLDSFRASRDMLLMAGIKLKQINDLEVKVKKEQNIYVKRG
jgi:dCMP deaminase